MHKLKLPAEFSLKIKKTFQCFNEVIVNCNYKVATWASVRITPWKGKSHAKNRYGVGQGDGRRILPISYQFVGLRTEKPKVNVNCAMSKRKSYNRSSYLLKIRDGIDYRLITIGLNSEWVIKFNKLINWIGRYQKVEVILLKQTVRNHDTLN